MAFGVSPVHHARIVTDWDAEGKNTQRSEVGFRPRQCAGYGCLPPLRLPPNIAASTLCARGQSPHLFRHLEALTSRS